LENPILYLCVEDTLKHPNPNTDIKQRGNLQFWHLAWW